MIEQHSAPLVYPAGQAAAAPSRSDKPRCASPTLAHLAGGEAQSLTDEDLHGFDFVKMFESNGSGLFGDDDDMFNGGNWDSFADMPTSPASPGCPDLSLPPPPPAAQRMASPAQGAPRAQFSTPRHNNTASNGAAGYTSHYVGHHSSSSSSSTHVSPKSSRAHAAPHLLHAHAMQQQQRAWHTPLPFSSSSFAHKEMPYDFSGANTAPPPQLRGRDRDDSDAAAQRDLQHQVDGRKRKQVKQYGKVLSTIRSNRAKPAKVVACVAVPKKDQRLKGVVYTVEGESKRWDGRQWRRLCVVDGCHSAARGSGDLCIAHSKGELRQVVINNEVVEVVALGEEAAACATAIAPVPDVIAAVANSRPHYPSPSAHTPRQLTQHASSLLGSKRKSEDAADEGAKMSKMIKTMSLRPHSEGPSGGKAEAAEELLDEEEKGERKACSFRTALGDACGNNALGNSAYCGECWCYVRSANVSSTSSATAVSR